MTVSRDMKGAPSRAKLKEVGSIFSEELFQGKREVMIRHMDSVYRLQITKANKLILIK